MTRSYDPDTTNKNPYYDDFDVSKGYLRSLFKPGTAVQARELTQIQTVLQNQIESIGSHIFENGAVVAGGGIGESNASLLRIDTTNTLSSTNLDFIVGKTITDGTVSARIFQTLPGSNLPSDPNQIVIYQYTSNGSFSPSSILSTTDGSGITFSIAGSGNVAPSITDDAVYISVDEGIFYADGFFVQSTKQDIAPYSISGVTTESSDERYRNFSTPTASVGFRVVRDIVDSEEDPSLKDPAAGFYNYNAPGADRYKVRLDLDFISFSASLGDSTGLTFDSDDFIELVRLVSGTSTKRVKYTDYAEIEETFARRTFDESGNYTVISPKIRVVEHGSVFTPGSNTKFAVGVEPNKSYVKGFEVDTQSTVYLEVDKTRTLGESYSEVLNTPVGNYVYIRSSGASGFGIGDTTLSSPAEDFVDMGEYFIYSADPSGGVTTGVCNVRSIFRDSSGVKLSLFNIQMNGSNKFSDSKYLVANKAEADGGHFGETGCHFTLEDDGTGWTGPHDADKRSLVFPVSKDRTVSEGPGSSTRFRSKFVVNTVTQVNLAEAETTATFTLTDGKSIIDEDDENFIIFYGEDTGDAASILPESGYDVSVFGRNLPNPTVEISGLTAGPVGGITFSVVHPVVYDSQNMSGQNIYRTLTVNSVTNESVGTSTVVSRNGVNAAEFTLSNSHVIDIDSIAELGIDITDQIDGYEYLDDGQRRSAIFKSKLYIPTANLNPDGGLYTVSVSYRYYSHAGIGPATVDSYPDDYGDIPSFVDPDSGILYNLRNCCDFRPVQKTDGSFSNFGIPYFKNRNSLSNISYSYYLPRVDLVALCSDRSYKVIQGVASDNPQPPVTTDEDMDLYLLKINPYVFDINKDVSVKYIENKRFTMREIGEISNQTDGVERDRNFEILYGDAIARGASESATLIEESTMVDDFSTQSFGDVSNRDHNCSIDYRDRGLFPPFQTKGLKWNLSSLPDGMALSDDRVLTYSFGSTEVHRGATGTGVLPINPYGITDFLGFLKLNPQSDFFYDNDRRPNVLVNTFGENNQYFIESSSWSQGKSAGWGGEKNEYLSHWLGIEDFIYEVAEIDPTSREYKSPVKSARAKLPDRITRTVNDKIVDESVVPYMKPVGVTFEAFGMLPNSTVYAIFDGVAVGDTINGYTCDSNGGVTGYVELPSGFLSGEKTFRLTDNLTNVLSGTNTAADAKFLAQGLQNTKSSTIISDISPETRRGSVRSEGVIATPYYDNLPFNFSEIQNGLDPLTQEIIVDAGTFPQGMFLNSIGLFFKTKDDTFPVAIQIRPMINGSPHEFLVIPHSTSVLNPAGIQVTDGPNGSLATTFSFGSPVFLPPGNWAVCLYTNGDGNSVFRSKINEPYLDTAGNVNNSGSRITSLNEGASGVRMGSLFLPLNNGTRMKKTDECVMMNVNRCSFNGGNKSDASRLALFNIDLGGTTLDASTVVVTANEQLFSSDSIRPIYSFIDGQNGGVRYNGITPNKNIPLISKIEDENTDSNVRLEIQYSATTSNAISPVVNLDRLGGVFADSKYSSAVEGTDTGASVGETQSNSASASTIARYISKKVNFGNSVANDLRVYLDIAARAGHVKVFAKVNESSDNFDSKDYVQLYRDGDTTKEYESDVDPNSLRTYTFKPATGTSIGEFSTYAVKIVIFADRGTPDESLPVIKNLRSVALRT